MKEKEQIVDNWLPRYTGVPLDGFGEHILLTNFGGYLGHFSRLTGAEVVGMDRPMPSATADGITMINFGMGSPNAATMMDLLSAIHPKAVLFLGRLVIDYDYVFCLTTTKTRSGIFENATQASFAILGEYRPIRAAAGKDTPFALRVIDSQNVFAGQGVTAVEAVRLIEAGEGAAKIRARLEYLAMHTHAYMVATDLHYLRARTRKRGDRSVSLLSATLGSALDIKPILHCNRGETGPVGKVKGTEAACQKLFDFAGKRVRAGLMTPTLCLGYGGELEEMRALPGYDALRATCAEYNIEVFESVMGLTGMVNVGKGTLVVGFAAEPHTFE